jgi:hypothetical protein
VEQRFLDLITVSQSPSPVGLVVGIDLAAYDRTVGPTLKTTTTGGYDKAWLLAFTHALGRMVEAQRMANHRTGADERVELFFGEKDEFRGRVEEMIKTVNADAAYPLGAVAFDTSENRNQPYRLQISSPTRHADGLPKSSKVTLLSRCAVSGSN